MYYNCPLLLVLRYLYLSFGLRTIHKRSRIPLREMDCSPSLDNVFGPIVAPCRRQFDFTFLFEESILSILPSSLFLVVVCYNIRTKVCRKQKSQLNSLYTFKLLLISIYFALEVAMLVEHYRSSVFKTPYTIPAAIMSVVTVLAMGALSHIEHTTSVRPSATLSAYLFISLIFDAARVRTLWLSMQNRSVSVLFTTTIGFKVAILILENTSKKLLPSLVDGGTSPEELCGIFSLSLYTWILPIIKLGYRKTLTIDDLYSIDNEMSSEVLGLNAQQEWDSITTQTLGRHRKGTLVWVVCKVLNTSIIVPAVPRLLLTGFTFAQPFLVNRMIKLLQNIHDESLSIGYGLLGAFVLVYIGIAIATAWYQRFTNRWIIMIRGILITLIYNKTLTMRSTEDERLGMSLMSNDVQRIVAGLKNLHETWACTLQAGLAIWLLEQQVGWATVGPVVVFLTCTSLIFVISNYTGERQRVWILATQKRVNATVNMLGLLKPLKMLCLESRYQSILETLRDQELSVSKGYRHLTTISIVLSYSTAILSPITVFVIYTAIAKPEHKTLDISRTFTSLTLITLLGAPLITLFQYLPSLRSALSCLQRIQVFLDGKFHHDYRALIRHQPSRDLHSQSLELPEKMSEVTSTLVSANLGTIDAVVIHEASFAWLPEKAAALRRISVRIAHGKLLMVIGPVGSGKSLLTKAILGEVAIVGGNISLSSNELGYCGQTIWLRNTTVRENIIAGSPFDEVWYSTVVHACAMDVDIGRFANGDLHVVGSGGVNLSGGQKQRIALARAIYARRKLLILDDIFSGIDAKTEGLIFHRLWGFNGLLRQLQTTVVLATHATHNLRYSDQILALSADGAQLEQGTLEELLTLNGHVASIYNTFDRSGKDSLHIEGDIIDHNAGEEKNEVTTGLSMKNTEPEKPHQAKDGAIYRYYYQAIGPVHSSIFAITALAFGVLLKIPDIWVKLWSDAEAKAPNQKPTYWIAIYSMFQILAIISLATSIWHLMSRFTISSGKRLHSLLLSSVLMSPFSFITHVGVGAIVNRFSQDLLLVDSTLPYALFDTATEMITCIIQLATMAISSVYIIAIYPFTFLLLYVLQRIYLRTSKQLRVMDLEATSPLYEHFLETTSGIYSIRAFSWQSAFRAQNNLLVDSSQRPMYTLWALQAWLGLVLDLIVASLALTVAGLAIGLRDSVNPSSIGVALLNLTSLGGTLKNVVMEWTSLENSMGAISRLESFNRATPSERYAHAGENQKPPEDWPNMGRVEFKEVTASYRYNSTLALDRISLLVEAGQRVAICGPSGSGKSSIILCLLGMLETSHGSIIVDGIDLSTISRQQICSRLGCVPQEPCYYPGSFRLNLDPSNCVSDDRVNTVLRKVRLHDKIQQEGGLDAQLCFDTFSHGQKQLFCLARAILKHSKILILDEATSSVDNETIELIEQVIIEECQDLTVISVIHRSESMKYYKKVFNLNNGKLVA
ncbi:P-loop containing nucleoside triphosphate hydrolase protein [Trichoderma camerunense]